MSPLVRSALTVENALLGFFYEKPAYGYEIHQELRRETGLGFVWRIKQSHLYALLDRLEAEGLLQGKVQVQVNRPAKKLFSLTDMGHQAFCAWMEEPVRSAREMRLEFMAKAYFAQKVGGNSWQTLLHRQGEVCNSWLDSLKQQEAAIPVQEMFSQQVLLYRIEQVKAILTWMESCKAGGLVDQMQIEAL
jgi:DNA-binding PadR family transcriptional regulator